MTYKLRFISASTQYVNNGLITQQRVNSTAEASTQVTGLYDMKVSVLQEGFVGPPLWSENNSCIGMFCFTACFRSSTWICLTTRVLRAAPKLWMPSARSRKWRMREQLQPAPQTSSQLRWHHRTKTRCQMPSSRTWSGNWPRTSTSPWCFTATASASELSHHPHSAQVRIPCFYGHLAETDPISDWSTVDRNCMWSLIATNLHAELFPSIRGCLDWFN